jgi:hypothetical protein
MPKAAWLPQHLLGSFQDLIEDAKPSLKKNQFEADVKNYLRSQLSILKLKPALLNSLFKKTSYCLRQVDALQKVQLMTKSPDWKRTRKIFLRLTHRDLPEIISRLERELTDPSLGTCYPLASASVRSLISQFEAIKEDLELTNRLAKNDEEQVSGHLKPGLESQFMLELDNHLARHLPPGVKIQDRRLLVGGCALAARIFPMDDASQDIQDRIASRIERARQSNRRESNKWNWGEQE